MLGGSIATKQLVDNGVPGPGTYNAGDDNEKARHMPGVKISEPPKRKENKSLNPGVGPQSYDPKMPKKPENAKDTFGRAQRSELGGNKYVPAPDKYTIAGDFDFKDPTKGKEDGQVGKVPKFCFGMKTNTRPKNLDMPGPGEYETDQHPMYQANIAVCMGTDLRKELAKPHAHLYPGPGHYDFSDGTQAGPGISFTHEAKQTKIVKTYAPGPGSYGPLDTVGIIPHYARNEANPRQAVAVPKRADME